MNALDAIATPQPQFTHEKVLRTLAAEFGLSGTLDSLISERDQNYRVTSSDGERFVFKIANRSESNLTTYEHAGDNQVLLWDLQHAFDLRDLIPYVEDTDLRAAFSMCLDDFNQRVQPELSSLRRQVIHGDLNTGNVLVADDHEFIAGVIDFGDMVRAPLIMEVAIAAAYLRVDEGDAVSLIAPFIAGYNGVTALEDVERDLLFDLVRARLVATGTILRWRLSERGKDDDYARQSLDSECTAEHFLLRLDTLGRVSFTERVRSACQGF